MAVKLGCLQMVAASCKGLQRRLGLPPRRLLAYSALHRADVLCSSIAAFSAPQNCWQQLPYLRRRRCRRRSGRTATLLLCPARLQVRKKRNREAEEAKPWCFLCCRGE